MKRNKFRAPAALLGVLWQSPVFTRARLFPRLHFLALPFGGYKQSGWGREMGHEVLDHYTQTKAVLVGL